MYSPNIEKRSLTLIFAFGLTIALMFAPTTYALNVSVVSDHIGDEFIRDIVTDDITEYVDRRDSDYVSFVDLINVRTRLTEESMLVTLHVLGKIPTDPTEDVNFAFGILAALGEDSFKGQLTVTEFPAFAVVVIYVSEPASEPGPGWVSLLSVAMAPDDINVYFDIPSFNVKKKHIAISISTSVLPITTFCWRGFTIYKNAKVMGKHQELNDITNINCPT